MTNRTIEEASLTRCEAHASRRERARRLLVVHRFPIVRLGVVKLVEERLSGMAIAETGTVSQALRSVQESDWDLVVIGLSFGECGGLELLKALKERRATLRVLVITAHTEALYARRCLKAGAAGLVTKDSSLTEVVDAIQAVMSGVRYVSPRVTQTLAARSPSRPVESASRVLSDRELEVMRLLTWGKTIREIASLLSVSTRTASACRSRVLRKLAMTNDVLLTLRRRASPRLRPYLSEDMEIRAKVSASVRGGGGAPPPVRKAITNALFFPAGSGVPTL